MTWTDRDGANRVVRRYPATVRLEEMEGGELRILPSAPYLAALLIADPTGTLADCVFYRKVRLEPECNARRGDNLYDRYKDLLKSAAEKEEAIEKALARVNEGQIFFTLLSIVPVEGITRSQHGAADEQLHIEDGILKPRIPLFPIFRRELAGDGWTTVPFAADVLFNLELLCAAPSIVVHRKSLYLYFKRDGSITQGPDTAQTAERGYTAILHLLESGALSLSEELRAAAHAEFTANRRVNGLFRHYMLSGRCASLEDFLDMTQNGRAPWVEAELAHLSEEPARAA
jgi:hypothetical protein